MNDAITQLHTVVDDADREHRQSPIRERVDSDGEVGYDFQPITVPWVISKLDLKEVAGSFARRRVEAARSAIAEAVASDARARAASGRPRSLMIEVLRRRFDEAALNAAARTSTDELFHEIDRQLGLPREAGR